MQESVYRADCWRGGGSSEGSYARVDSIRRSSFSYFDFSERKTLRCPGSGLIDQSQKMTAAAMQMAEKKVWAQRS